MGLYGFNHNMAPPYMALFGGLDGIFTAVNCIMTLWVTLQWLQYCKSHTVYSEAASKVATRW